MQLVSPPVPSPSTRRLAEVAVAGAFLGGRAATTGGGTTVAKGNLIIGDDVAPPSAIILTIIATVALWAAPCTWAVFPEYPHIEGRDAIVPEVEGAPPVQASHAGK